MVIILQVERLKSVIKLIEEKDIVKINDLCEKYSVSKATIRRDLKKLEENKKIIRIYGGAVKITRGTSIELPFNIKKTLYTEEKQRIGAAAFKEIKQGETIIIDAGTTTLELARKIKLIKNITIVTNDLTIANELNNDGSDTINLVVVGGILRKGFYRITGIFAEIMLKSIHADKAFLGVDAVDLKYGFMGFNIEEIPIKRLMLKASKKTIILCDHTKFETVAFIDICSFAQVDKIITGKEINSGILRKFKEQNIEIEVV